MSDCAEHPADFEVSTWSEVTCATCEEQDYDGEQPSVSCFYGDIESTPTPSAGSGSGEDDYSGDDSVVSPSPTSVGSEDNYSGDASVVSPSPISVGSEDDDSEGMNIMVCTRGFHMFRWR